MAKKENTYTTSCKWKKMCLEQWWNSKSVAHHEHFIPSSYDQKGKSIQHIMKMKKMRLEKWWNSKSVAHHENAIPLRYDQKGKEKGKESCRSFF